MVSERSEAGSAALWRRLDVPGHDYCQVSAYPSGYRLEGVAVYLDALGAARIDYAVECDARWRSLAGQVRASIGADRWDVRIVREPDGGWTLNDVAVPGLEDCEDLDYGFTPATNLLQTRRLALAVGDAADAPAAWMEPPGLTLTRLPQRYERIAEDRYRYDSPAAGYHETLEMHDSGFVRTYPGLWVLESAL
jgi:hypothetical protein